MQVKETLLARFGVIKRTSMCLEQRKITVLIMSNDLFKKGLSSAFRPHRSNNTGLGFIPGFRSLLFLPFYSPNNAV
jgi:hypothetical protein